MRYPQLQLCTRVEALQCSALPEGMDKAQPYLWPIYFKVDGTCLHINRAFRLEGRAELFCPEGSQGNLGIAQMQAGQRIAIPRRIGEHRFELKALHLPIFEQPLPAFFGLLAVLVDSRHVSLAGAEAGRRSLAEEVERAVNASLRAFDPKVVELDDVPGSILRFFKARFEAEAAVLPQRVAQAVQREQNILQNIWSLVKRDELIGFHAFTFSHESFGPGQQRLPFAHEWRSAKLGTWQLSGHVEQVPEAL